MIEGVIMFCQINNLFSLSQSSLRSCPPYICTVSFVWILYNDTFMYMLWFNFILGLNFISLLLGYCNVTEFETKKNKI